MKMITNDTRELHDLLDGIYEVTLHPEKHGGLQRIKHLSDPRKRQGHIREIIRSR